MQRNEIAPDSRSSRIRVGLACRIWRVGSSGVGVLDLHGDVGQVGEFGQALPVMRRIARARGGDRDDGAEMPGPEPPEMQVGDLIALGFDESRTLSAMRGSGVRSSRMPPVSRNSPTDQLAMTSAPTMPASGSIQSQPNARASSRPDDHQHRDRGIGHDVNDGGAHIVVAVMRAGAMLVVVLLEFQLAFVRLARLHQANPGEEGVRLRNFVARFEDSRRGRRRQTAGGCRRAASSRW